MELFDEAAVFEPNDGVIVISNKIKSLNPEIIYYPSIGMSEMAILLCNLRLAPIQIASVGHPATTQSTSIDYMIMGHEYFGSAEAFSEQVILLRSGGAMFDPGSPATSVKPAVRGNPETLRIAVPSSPMKLNGSFLNLCGRIAEGSGRALEYWFYRVSYSLS